MGAYISDITLKTVSACSGANAVTGLGNNTDGRYYAEGLHYDLTVPPGPRNQLDVALNNRGASRLTSTPSQENAVQEYVTVFLKTQPAGMADGCAFDIYLLAGRRPMEMPSGE